jgi:cation transport regulator ChaC
MERERERERERGCSLPRWEKIKLELHQTRHLKCFVDDIKGVI